MWCSLRMPKRASVPRGRMPGRQRTGENSPEMKRTRGASNRNTQRSAQVRETLMFWERFCENSEIFHDFRASGPKCLQIKENVSLKVASPTVSKLLGVNPAGGSFHWSSAFGYNFSSSQLILKFLHVLKLLELLLFDFGESNLLLLTLQ